MAKKEVPTFYSCPICFEYGIINIPGGGRGDRTTLCCGRCGSLEVMQRAWGATAYTFKYNLKQDMERATQTAKKRKQLEKEKKMAENYNRFGVYFDSETGEVLGM